MKRRKAGKALPPSTARKQRRVSAKGGQSRREGSRPVVVVKLFKDKNDPSNAHIEFEHTERTPVRVCETKEAFCGHLLKFADTAFKTKQRWVHAASAGWIQQLFRELKARRKAIVKKYWNQYVHENPQLYVVKSQQPATTTITGKQDEKSHASPEANKADTSKSNEPKKLADDEKAVSHEMIYARWLATSQLASFILLEWFAQHNTSEEVIQKCIDLNQHDLEGAYVLRGAYVEQKLSQQKDLSLEGLKKKLKQLCPTDDLNVFRLEGNNPFRTVKYDVKSVDALLKRRRTGSLNTIYHFHKNKAPTSEPSAASEATPPTAVPTEELLQYHDALESVFVDCDINEDDSSESYMERFYFLKMLHLNADFYFIWKFIDFVTAYHQDTHTFPHMVLYNQTSGVSTFHFLPPLIGLYVTFFGRLNEKKLRKLLMEIDKLRIGSVHNLSPGDVICIMPFGSHGVWVPDPMKNEGTMGKFTVSAIRAAEIFVRQTNEKLYKELGERHWNPLDSLMR